MAAACCDLVMTAAAAAVSRNGYLPERAIQTELGDIAVKVPKVRDRPGSGIKFNSRLIPPYLKRKVWGEQLLYAFYFIIFLPQNLFFFKLPWTQIMGSNLD